MNHQRLVCLAIFVLLGLAAFAWLAISRMVGTGISAIATGYTGEVDSQDDWPRPLKKLLQAAHDSKIDFGDADVFCLANGLSTEYIWKMDSTPGMFDLMLRTFALAVHSPPLDGRFRAQNHLPRWWDPKQDIRASYYSANLGNIGEQFVVLHDETNRKIYVHYYDNW